MVLVKLNFLKTLKIKFKYNKKPFLERLKLF